MAKLRLKNPLQWMKTSPTAHKGYLFMDFKQSYGRLTVVPLDSEGYTGLYNHWKNGTLHSPSSR